MGVSFVLTPAHRHCSIFSIWNMRRAWFLELTTWRIDYRTPGTGDLNELQREESQAQGLLQHSFFLLPCLQTASSAGTPAGGLLKCGRHRCFVWPASANSLRRCSWLPASPRSWGKSMRSLCVGSFNSSPAWVACASVTPPEHWLLLSRRDYQRSDLASPGKTIASGTAAHENSST